MIRTGARRRRSRHRRGSGGEGAAGVGPPGRGEKVRIPPGASRPEEDVSVGAAVRHFGSTRENAPGAAGESTRCFSQI